MENTAPMVVDLLHTCIGKLTLMVYFTLLLWKFVAFIQF